MGAALSDFKRLFWAIRKQLVRSAGEVNVDDLTTQAIDVAARFQILGGSALIEALGLDAKERFEEATVLLNDLFEHISPDLEGHRLFCLGSVLYEREMFDTSIEAYQKALATPGFDAPGKALYNLGLTFNDKGDTDSSIDAYQKALATGLDAPGGALNNLGNAFCDKGDIDSGIDAYQRALATAGFDSPAAALNNLASAFHAKGDYNRAIDIYREALSTPGVEPAKVRCNLAIALRDAGRLEDAQAEINAVLSSSSDVDPQQRQRARLIKKLLNDMLPAEALQSAERRQVEPKAIGADNRKPQSTEERVKAKVRNAKESQYDKYLKLADSTRANQLSILRGWSSSVTLLDGSHGQWRGGGYFLKWHGKGMVIDPGFDFLHNFHDAGFHGREIDAVVVSHNHPDHNAEVKHLDDLRYEIWNACTRADQPTPEPYVLVMDLDTRDQHKEDFCRAEGPQRHPPIIFDVGRCSPLDCLEQSVLHDFPCTITYFRAQHSADVPNATSFVITLLDEGGAEFRLGYTADTRYYPELKDRLGKCDVLIAHISQPDYEEYDDVKHRKKVHLGYRGLIQLLSEVKPPLVLIGEFWAGLTDLRIDLSQGLREQSGVRHILPTSVGMHIRLPSREIECTECGTPTPFEEIRVAPPADIYGSLSYLCPKCML
jgi:tetratricopeptide (TPR) repeat protein/phosphoribosyl 1,2-cyclic phosphodiesterase